MPKSSEFTTSGFIALRIRVSAITGIYRSLHCRRSTQFTDPPTARDSTFKLPSRVTLNDQKRNLFLKELGDPKVPLHKLAKSVPHGTKNAELLDVLFKNEVPSSRSGWYIGTLGAIEMVGWSCPSRHGFTFSILIDSVHPSN